MSSHDTNRLAVIATKSGLSIVDARLHYAYPGGRVSDHAALAATFDLKWKRR